MPADRFAAFAACFADLPDPRDSNVRHDLHEILLIALCAVPGGAEDGADMALFGQAQRTTLAPSYAYVTAFPVTTPSRVCSVCSTRCVFMPAC
jgi:DDE_Tnp_1-associated